MVRFHQLGGPEVLQIEDVPAREPGPGEVRVRVRAIGLNRADALLRSGNYIEPALLPTGLGQEAAGLVETLGPGVTGLLPGDAVSLIPPRSVIRWPSYAELAVFPATHLVQHPAALSWEQAAATWMPFLTAYGGLVWLGGLRQGESVVITAASSSVGLAAIQIANRLGAVPIAVTRGAGKRQALLDAGAAHVVVMNEEDLGGRLAGIAGPEQVRLVFDAVGGPGFMPLTAAMAPGGMLIEYGGLSPEPTPFPLPAVLGKSLTLRGYLVHELIADAAALEGAKAFILAGLNDGTLRPSIARVFELAEIVAAHRFLEANGQVGKIVVRV